MSQDAEKHIRAFLAALQLDAEADAELIRTPERFAELIAQMTVGLREPPPTMSTFEVERADGGASPGPVMLVGLSFHSLCVHHLVPFFGTIDVAYVPGTKMVGFGSIGRVIDHFARRPQVQERLVAQIAEYLNDALEPRGLLIRCRARQMCMELRGAKKTGTLLSFASRGCLESGALRHELVAQFSEGQVPL
ncbi:MAG: GTP cyclohydrolase I [Bradymonadaceae bacterium]